MPPGEAPQPWREGQRDQDHVEDGDGQAHAGRHLGVQLQEALGRERQGQRLGPPVCGGEAFGDGGAAREQQAERRDQIAHIGIDLVGIGVGHGHPEGQLAGNLEGGHQALAAPAARQRERQQRREQQQQQCRRSDPQLQRRRFGDAEHRVHSLARQLRRPARCEDRPRPRQQRHHAARRRTGRARGVLADQGEWPGAQGDVAQVEVAAEAGGQHGCQEDVGETPGTAAGCQNHQRKGQQRTIRNAQHLGAGGEAEPAAGKRRGPRPRLAQPEAAEEARRQQRRGQEDVDVLAGRVACHGRREQHQERRERPAAAGAELPGDAAGGEREQQAVEEERQVDVELAVRRRHPPPQPERAVGRHETVVIDRMVAEDRPQVAALQPVRGQQQVIHQAVPGEGRPEQPAQRFAAERGQRDDGERRMLPQPRPAAGGELRQRLAQLLGAEPARPAQQHDHEQQLQRQRPGQEQAPGGAQHQRDPDRLGGRRQERRDGEGQGVGGAEARGQQAQRDQQAAQED